MSSGSLRGLVAPFACKCGGRVVMLREGWTCEDCGEEYELGAEMVWKVMAQWRLKEEVRDGWENA